MVKGMGDGIDVINVNNSRGHTNIANELGSLYLYPPEAGGYSRNELA